MPAKYLETRDIPIAELTPYPGNARRGDVDRIRESVRANGQYRSLVVRRRAGSLVVLAGNHTLAALRAEGAATVRCELFECDDDTALRINLVDNRAAELGSYDDEALALLLRQLDDPLGSGWLDDEIAVLLADDSPDGVLADAAPEPDLEDDEAELELPAAPVTRSGDVWLLGPHRLMCGDCRDAETLQRAVGELTPDLVYTDPPYGVRAVPKDGGVSRGKPFGKKSEQGARAQIVEARRYAPVVGDETTATATDVFHALGTAYPKARHVWWGGNHYAGSAVLPDASCWLVWDKQNGESDFADAELAWTNHPGAVRIFRHMWHGMLRASERGPRVHPTQKPVALAEWAFGVVDKNAERRVVLDVFGGSGSTMLAAHRTGRTAVVMEIEPAYVDVICRRYQALTGEKPVLEATGEAHDFSDGSGA